MFMIFKYRGLHHLELYCTLFIEERLKLNMCFDSRYLELLNIEISLNMLLNAGNRIECQYPSIVFLSILKLD